MHTNVFKSFVRRAFAATPIIQLLDSKPAIVLERIARGGGVTKWYYCSSPSNFELIADKLTPASVVSFYFDDRIKCEIDSPVVRDAIDGIFRQHTEIMVGSLSEDGLYIEMEIITGPNELAEVMLTIKPASRIFYGLFPARDNDEAQAVTLILPDADGAVRAHPH